MNIQEIRQKYPQYSDLSDTQLADGFHSKFYSDIPKETFYQTLGVKTSALEEIDKINGAVTPIPQQEDSTLNKYVVGPAEAAASTASGMLLGPLGGLSNMIRKGKLNEQTFVEGMDSVTYSPKTESGKEQAEAVGKAIEPLTAIMPDVAMLHGLHQPIVRGKILPDRKLSPEQQRYVDELKTQTEMEPVAPTESANPFKQGEQLDLDLGSQNKFGVDTSKFVQDENGMLYDPELSKQTEVEQVSRATNPPIEDTPLFAKENVDKIAERKQMDADAAHMQELQRKAAIERMKQQDELTAPMTPEETIQNKWEQRIRSGKFGRESGAINPDAFLKDFPEFVASTVKDAFGKLKEVYHGTTSKTPIEEFKTVRGLRSSEPYEGDLGTWFTDKPAGTDTFAGARTGVKDGAVYPSYLNLKKPKIFDSYAEFKKWFRDNTVGKSSNYARRSLIKAGFDGIEIRNSTTDGGPRRTDYVAFTPEQIKSSTAPMGGVGKRGFKQGGAINLFGGKTPQRNLSILHRIRMLGEAPDFATMKPLFDKMQDLQKPLHWLVSKVMSSSNVAKDFVNHPAYDWQVNLVNKFKQQYEIMAKKALSDRVDGIVPKIRLITNFFSGGHGMVKDYFKWRFENEGKNTPLPSSFSPKIRELHDLINKHKDDLLKAINEIRTAQGKSILKGIENHIVHYWSGPYRAYVYATDAKGRKRLVTFISEKSQGNAEKAIKFIKTNLPHLDVSDVKFISEDARGRSSMFDHLLELENNNDPVIQGALEKLMASMNESERKHFGEHFRQSVRTGVTGYMGKKPWLSEAENYRDTISTLHRTFDAGYEWVALQKVKEQLSPFQKEYQESLGNVIAAGQMYVDHAFGRNKETSAITKFLDGLEKHNPKTFGGTRRVAGEVLQFGNRVSLPLIIGFAKGTQIVQSVIQPVQVGLSRMRYIDNQLGVDSGAIGATKSVAYMGKSIGIGMIDGLNSFVDMVSGGFIKKIAPIESKETTAIRKAISDWEISSMSLVDTHAMFPEGGRASTVANQLANLILSGPLKLLEGPTRSWFFGAVARYAMDKGIPLKDALDIARTSMDSMTNYAPEGKAPMFDMMGPLGQSASGLHTFLINSFSQQALYVKEAIKGNPGPAAMYYAQLYIYGGLVGMVGMDFADWMLDNIKSAYSAAGGEMDADMERFSLRGYLMENAPDMLSFGPLSTLTGLGLYGSFTSKVVDPSRSFLENIAPVTSYELKALGGAVDYAKAYTDPMKGAAMQKFAPAVQRESIRNKYMTQKDEEGNTQVLGPDGIPQYTRTPREQQIAENGRGVVALSEAKNKELVFSNSNLDVAEAKRTKELMGKLTNKYIDAIRGNNVDGNMEDIGKLVSRLVENRDVSAKQIEAAVTSASIRYGVGDKLSSQIVSAAKRSQAKKLERDLELQAEFNRNQQRYGNK